MEAAKKRKSLLRQDNSFEELQKFIENLVKDRWSGAVQVRQSALNAYVMALERDCRVLEAEALLQMGRSFTPMVFPEEAFVSIGRAEKIFTANRLPIKAAECRVVAARALFDMGRDRDAIAYAHAALRVNGLSIEYGTAAFVVAALSHGHLGELDKALQLMKDHALPMSEKPGARPVRPHALRAMAALQLQLLLSTTAPTLWRGLPGMPRIHAGAASLQEILGLVEAARKSMPKGKTWGIIEMAQLVIEGFEDESKRPLRALQAWADACVAADPPVACWALFCKAIVLQFRGQAESALLCLDEALDLARRWEMTLAVGDIRLQMARICEALGDTAGSLQNYKEFWSLRVRSMHQSVALEEPDGPRSADEGAQGPEASSSLRAQEPAFVSQALDYVERNLSIKLKVTDIAEQCGVSRRSLEIAFKKSRATTVARYVKRRRLEQAAEALRNTNCSILEIGRSVGYMSSAAFSRDFLACFGAQPTEWRRRG